jgi:palmitoyl-protein thioesterase
MGVTDVPECQNGQICQYVNYVARNLVYFKLVQNYLGPAGYFRDPTKMDSYLADSVFLPYLNNEVGDDATKATVKTRFSALNAAMLVMFSEDTVVYPKESEWFQ